METVNKQAADWFFAMTTDDAVRAQREGKIGVFLGVGDGHMIDSGIAVLRQLHRLGARYVGRRLPAGLEHIGKTPNLIAQ